MTKLKNFFYFFKLFQRFSFFFIFIAKMGSVSSTSLLAWNIQIINLEDKNLKKLLEKYFLKSSASFILRLKFVNKKKMENYIDKKINNIIKVNSFKNLIFLENVLKYLQYFGNFTNCYLIRKIYLKKLIQFQIHSKFINLNSLKACLELNKPELVMKFLETKWFFKYRISYLSQLNEIRNYSQFLQTKNKKKLKILSGIEDKKYFKIISRSNVIVSGPKTKIKNTQVKNKIIIAFNLLLKNLNKNIISYYNTEIGNKVLNNNKMLKILDDLIYVCFKSSDTNELKKKFFSNKSFLKNKRIYYKADNILLNNFGANSIQNIIYDLLIYRPKNIFLTGVTFYLGNNLFKKSYTTSYFLLDSKYVKIFSDIKGTKKNVLKALRLHDPFSNFSFIKNLWKRGIINVSSNVEKYLKISEIDYALKLDENFKVK